MSWVRLQISATGRMRRRIRPRGLRRLAYQVAVPATVLAAAAYSTGYTAPDAGRDIADVRGSRVVLLIDVSGSMSGTETLLQGHIDTLMSTQKTIVRQPAMGFGFTPQGTPDNALYQLEQALHADSAGINAVYLFSDFDYIDEPIDGNNPAGYEQLRALLREYGLRFYLGSVRYQPPPEMARIARLSGGGSVRASDNDLLPTPESSSE